MGFLFRSIRAVIVIAAAAGIAVFLVSVKSGPEKRTVSRTVPLVEGMKVQKVSRVMEVEAFGTVEPLKSVKISAEVPGRIDYINPLFEEGEKIEKDELLIRIDRRSYRFDRDAARVRLQQARTDMKKLEQEVRNLESDLVPARRNLDLAQREFERLKSLSKGEYASKTSLENAEKMKLQARMSLNEIRNRLELTDVLTEQKRNAIDMARVDLEKAELALEKTEIKAGFDSIVSEKNSEHGEYVAAGQLLGAVFQEDLFKVDVRIPLEKLKWLPPLDGSGGRVVADVEISGPAGKDSVDYSAELLRIKGVVDKKTRTLPLTFKFAANSGEPETESFELMPGLFVKCRIKGVTRENIFEVPRHLVNRNDTVFLVEDGKLRKVDVGILRRFEEKVYIDRGLRDGDIILTTPMPGASGGRRVKLEQVGETSENRAGQI
ncbi:MAG: efflux RND transporter periplasmic adaptor subunit [Thermodesulfobacteriota bacterium]